MKKHRSNHFATASDLIAPVIKRFNRMLKIIMQRCFTTKNTVLYRYLTSVSINWVSRSFTLTSKWGSNITRVQSPLAFHGVDTLTDINSDRISPIVSC